MKPIIQIDRNKYYLENRGSKMTLTKEPDGTWQMMTDNASRRAHRGLGIKLFNSLKEVEAQYKSWKGISILINHIAGQR